MTWIAPRDTRSTERAADWRDNGACLTEDSSLFFPKGTEGPWLIVIAQAKAICRRCPVRDACLSYALDNNVTDGIFGGLTERERAAVRRAATKKKQSREATLAHAEAVRERKSYTSLRELFDDSTEATSDGHLAWTGPSKPYLNGQPYNPKQVAFILDRGRQPEGRVLSGCGNATCVLPLHVADNAERMRCGTRPGYQRHLRERTQICDRCRQANSNADNRLRRTGTTRVSS